MSDDNDSIFHLKKPGAAKRRGKKKTPPKKQVSTTKTRQTSAMSSSVASASANCTRTCYRMPSRRGIGLVKRLSSRKTSPFKECVDDVIEPSSSSSSSCLTYTSNDERVHDDSAESDCDMGDKYEVEESEPTLTVEWQQRGEKEDTEEESFQVSQASLHVQDCVEEQDALVLQLHIPSQDVSENLDVEYLPFKIPAMKSGIA
jgi:hypothetical protein